MQAQRVDNPSLDSAAHEIEIIPYPSPCPLTLILSSMLAFYDSCSKPLSTTTCGGLLTEIASPSTKVVPLHSLSHAFSQFCVKYELTTHIRCIYLGEQHPAYPSSSSTRNLTNQTTHNGLLPALVVNRPLDLKLLLQLPQNLVSCFKQNVRVYTRPPCTTFENFLQIIKKLTNITKVCILCICRRPNTTATQAMTLMISEYL